MGSRGSSLADPLLGPHWEQYHHRERKSIRSPSYSDKPASSHGCPEAQGWEPGGLHVIGWDIMGAQRPYFCGWAVAPTYPHFPVGFLPEQRAVYPVSPAVGAWAVERDTTVYSLVFRQSRQGTSSSGPEWGQSDWPVVRR